MMKQFSLAGVLLLCLTSAGCNVLAVAFDKESVACKDDEACPDGYYCADSKCKKGDRPADAGQADVAVDAGGSDLRNADGAQPDQGSADRTLADLEADDAAVPDAFVAADVDVEDAVAEDAVGFDLRSVEDGGVEDGGVVGEDAAVGEDAGGAGEDAGGEDAGVDEDAAQPCVDEDNDSHFPVNNPQCANGDDYCDDNTLSWQLNSCFECIDVDGDGTYSGCDRYEGVEEDCDDNNAARSPLGIDLPDDGVDQDCSGEDFKVGTASTAIVVDASHESCTDDARGIPAAPNCSIVAALGYASQGDSIFVAEGVYVGDLDIVEEIGLFGGYFSDWSRDMVFARTEIVGNVNATVALIIQGFAIHGRDGTRVEGLALSGLGAHHFVADCEIYGGVGGDSAGVKLSQTAATVVRSKIFSGFSARNSFGLLIEQSQVTAVNSEIYASAGSEGSFGVKLDLRGASATLLHNYIKADSAANTYGVWLDNLAAQAILVNNIVDPGNAVTTATGVLTEGPPVVLHNNNIYSEGMNCVVSSGGCLDITEIANCGSWQSGACQSSRNNISEPLGIRVSSLPGIRLNPSSACRNAGADPLAFYRGGLFERDAEGDTRPQEGDWDIGPDEIFGLHVDKDHTSCVDTGGSLEAPTCSIGAALAMATDGQAIYITRGPYEESLDATGLRAKLLGGYESDDWSRSEDDYTLLRPVDSQGIFSNTGSKLTMEGFDVLGTEGLAVKEFASKLIVNDCLLGITGGGWQSSTVLSSRGGFTRISNSVLHAGEGNNSHGLELYDTSSVLVNCTIIGGDADSDSYGVSANSSKLVAYNNYFEQGHDDTYCIQSNSSDLTMVNNTCDGRRGKGATHGVELLWGGQALLVNNNFIGNGASVGIITSGFVEMTALVNNLFYGFGDIVEANMKETYNLSEVNGCSGWTDGCDPKTSGNISGDPGLLGLYPWDPRIGPGSAGLAGGTTTALHGVVVRTDFEGHPRSMETPDIGADEVYGYYVDPAVSGCETGIGARDKPMCHISNAIDGYPRDRPIFAAVGSYTCPVTITDDVVLYGGFDSRANWRRVTDSHTDFTGTSGTECLQITGQNVVIQDVKVSGFSNDGINSTGVLVASSADLLLADSIVSAGVGAQNRGVDIQGAATLLRNSIDGGDARVDSASGVLVGTYGVAVAIGNVITAGHSTNANTYGFWSENSVVLVNNTIFGGSPNMNSYALNFRPGDHVVLNNILDCGTGTLRCYGALTWPKSTIVLYNNDLWGAHQICALHDGNDNCVTDMNDCASWTSCQYSGGNISSDHTVTVGGYALRSSSACIDAGKAPESLPELLGYEHLLSRDLEYEFRPRDGDAVGGAQWDIGADEY